MATSGRTTEKQTEKVTIYRFVGDGSLCVPGVPMADLTEEAWDALVENGRITKGSPAAELWEKARVSRPSDGGAETPGERPPAGASPPEDAA